MTALATTFYKCVRTIVQLFLSMLGLSLRKKTNERVDPELLRKRLESYKPEPLVEDVQENFYSHNKVLNKEEGVVDLARVNYLDMLDDLDCREKAQRCVRKYGVGTCGPWSFFGATDVHVTLDSKLASFLGTEYAVVYSDGFCAISSAIGAYCKRTDVVFCDEHVNIAIEQGFQPSNCRVVRFPQNNTEALAREAESINTDSGVRKMLILEGISKKTGKICALNKFLAVARLYKMRIFLDESVSLGVLGKTGRGVIEHCNMHPDDVDVIMATFDGALGSIGGFSTGRNINILDQNSRGLGHLFSATMPTLLCETVLISLEKVEQKTNVLKTLSYKIHKHIACFFDVISDPGSPMVIFKGRNKTHTSAIHDYFIENSVYIIYEDDRLIMHLYCNLYCEKKNLKKVLQVVRNASKHLQ